MLRTASTVFYSLSNVAASAYHLLRQLSSGSDGVRYLAASSEGDMVVRLERLFMAKEDADRWRVLESRLKLTAEIAHPNALGVIYLDTATSDPTLVCDHLETTLPSVWQGGTAKFGAANIEDLDSDRAFHHPARRVRAQLAGVAGALAQAHRLGLAHGRVCPSNVWIGPQQQLVVDLAGTLTEPVRELTELDAPFIDPRSDGAEADVRALAVLACLLLTGELPRVESDGAVALPAGIGDGGVVQHQERFSADLVDWLTDMMSPDPSARPNMRAVEHWLRAGDVGLEDTSVSAKLSDTLPTEGSRSSGERLGRFELLDLLGQGGMGRVYRARDIADGSLVALKVLHPHWHGRSDGLLRFHREARVLAGLDNPHIARFVEVNEDRGVHYLAMELLEGEDLDERLVSRGPLPVSDALDVVHDVALALADVHALGVVHRDVKPANVILMEHDGRVRAKLCDFGIARSTGEGASDNVTRANAAVGTPEYMAPEQCVGGDVDARADIYALGVTLYKMLTGETPFSGSDARAIVMKHLHEAPPDPRKRCPELGDSAAAMLERMLAKAPEQRFADARALLEELVRIRRGAPSRMEAHPPLPHGTSRALEYDFEWTLRSAPEQLWPYVSNTERINRAIGLGAVDYTRSVQDGVVQTHGKVRLSGMDLVWREHPYEWVTPRRMAILREFSQGPFVWLASKVELVPHAGGTRLCQHISLEPRGVLGRAAAEMQMRLSTKRNFDRVYHRIDDYLSERRGPRSSSFTLEAPTSQSAGADPFEAAPKLSDVQIERIEMGRERLVGRGVDPQTADGLCDYLRRAPDPEAGRIRPRSLARRLAVDDHDMLRACLVAAAEGLLLLLWDIICPRCQIPSSIEQSLRSLSEHQHCDACDLAFEADFGSSIEIVFRVHPSVRESEMGTYCIGGPGHTPHVVAQVRLAPDERFDLDLALPEGSYVVRAKQLPLAHGFRVAHGALLEAWDLTLGQERPPGPVRVLASARQRLLLHNDYEVEVAARIERSTGREDAVTAAEIVCSKLFRDLFPAEVLRPGRLVTIHRVALMLVELGDAWLKDDEASVFARLSGLQERVDRAAAAHGGAAVKIHGDGVLAAFPEPEAATRAALELFGEPATPPDRLVVHAGPAMVTSINDRLDYFGRVVQQAVRLLGRTAPGQLVLGEPVYADPGVAQLLAAVDAERAMVQDGELIAQALGAPPPLEAARPMR